MKKEIRSKFDAKPLIFEALSELRTVPEALHYIRDKYGSDKEVSGSTIYYWINKIRENKEPEYRLNEVGDKYQFVLKESEKKIDENWCIWFMESYKRAIKEKDHLMNVILKIELQDKVFSKTIDYEPFIDFLIDRAKKESYEYFENMGIYVGEASLVFWRCVERLSYDYRFKVKNDKILKKINKMEIFFKDVTLDWDRKYSIERLLACYALQHMQSKLLRNVIIELVKNADPIKRPIDYPGAKKGITEYSMFRMMIRQNLTSGLRIFSITEARQILIDAYEYRKKKFGLKDKELSEVLQMFEWLREESPVSK